VSNGQLRKHERFRSRFLRNQRDLIVYTPPGYDEQASRQFPVLYMQDGQNLFDGSTSFVAGMYWRIAETADEAIVNAVVEPLVIVGIYNAGKPRINEYTPTKDARAGGGRADRYAKFLLQEIMPFIQTEYRVLRGPASTGIGGSSLGGLASLYIGLKFPQIFGRITALSPSVWWNNRVILRLLREMSPQPRPRIWLDVGTREGARTVPDVEQFRDLLLKKGWRLNGDLHYQRAEGGEHNEAAWAQRVGPFLQFLFPATEAKV
jgi:predicted alpha/beta superfamily hydrolase